MRGVGADVAAFVVRVDGEVEAHELDEVLVVGEAELVRQVVAVVFVLLHGRHFAVFEDVAVDARGDGGEFGDGVHAVFEGVLPVLRLLHAAGVGFREGGLVLEGCDGEGELCHWVQVAGAAVDELVDEGGDVRSCRPLAAEVADLLLSRHLSSKQQPEETFW